jgi:hypothetical protein
MTDLTTEPEQLPLEKLNPEREPTPERIGPEVDFVLAILMDNIRTVVDWYYDAEPFWEALSEKLGKTAVKKIQEGLDTPLSP